MASLFSSWTAKIANTVTNSVTNSVATIKTKLKPEESLPPWKLLPDELKDKEEVIKTQIEMLSKDKWSFMQSPPKEALATFEFDLQATMPVARAAMGADPFVKSLHYFLVPDQVKEDDFWYNYFAHIHVIFTSLGGPGWKTPVKLTPPEPTPETSQTAPPATSEDKSAPTISETKEEKSNPSTSQTTSTPQAESTTEQKIELTEEEELAILEEASNANLEDLGEDVDFDELQEEIGKALEE